MEMISQNEILQRCLTQSRICQRHKRVDTLNDDEYDEFLLLLSDAVGLNTSLEGFSKQLLEKILREVLLFVIELLAYYFQLKLYHLTLLIF